MAKRRCKPSLTRCPLRGRNCCRPRNAGHNSSSDTRHGEEQTVRSSSNFYTAADKRSAANRSQETNSSIDRLIFVCLYRLRPGVCDALAIVKPETVVTWPAPIGDIAYHNKAVVHDLLFKASAETLTTIVADPRHLGARVGITSVLHSWGSAMTHHPHVHMIVPGGGISLDGERWVACRPGFFLPVRVLSRLFRRLFLEKLTATHEEGRLKFFGDHATLADAQAFAAYLTPLRRAEWVVYAKRPFGGPQAVLAYLSRYTHRVAIANSRLIACDRTGVTFRWKDYRADGRERQKIMTLATGEFIRRFLIHVLPTGLHRLRP